MPEFMLIVSFSAFHSLKVDIREYILSIMCFHGHSVKQVFYLYSYLLYIINFCLFNVKKNERLEELQRTRQVFGKEIGESKWKLYFP